MLERCRRQPTLWSFGGRQRQGKVEVKATGAVVIGRRTFELADGRGGDLHDGVPMMGKSWVYRRLRSGEIPSVKLDRSIKVNRADLEE